MKTIGIILAAGKGTRMNSLYNETAKVCFKIFDKTMIEYVLDTLHEANIQDLITIVGYKSEDVITLLNDKSQYVYQKEQKGTGHAIMQVLPQLPPNQIAVIVCGDTPLLTAKTMNLLIQYHQNNHNDATILEAEVQNPYGYGRLVKKQNQLMQIVEQKDASEEIQKIKTINTGVYVINTNELLQYIPLLKPKNQQNEYYLTDIFQLMVQNQKKVSCYPTTDCQEFLGVNDRIQLAHATKNNQKRINEKHMLKGVTIIDHDTTYIGKDVLIANHTIIFPNSYLDGQTIIGANCKIGPNVMIHNALIQDCVIIDNVVVKNQHIDIQTKQE